jgi:hypothetical protein
VRSRSAPAAAVWPSGPSRDDRVQPWVAGSPVQLVPVRAAQELVSLHTIANSFAEAVVVQKEADVPPTRPRIPTHLVGALLAREP